MDVAQTFAATFVDELAAQGVEYACVSPGSRSAPVAMALQRHPRIKVIVQIDERSGSFFGLGIGKATGKPAVLLSTSGTAAAEFHPAVVEASYSRTPLIVITADRPPELRDVGANQAIDQQHLYGTAVRWFFDPGPPVDIPGAVRTWRRLAARAVEEAAAGRGGARLAAPAGRDGRRGRVIRGPAARRLVSAAWTGPGDSDRRHANLACPQCVACRRVTPDLSHRPRPLMARPGLRGAQRSRL